MVVCGFPFHENILGFSTGKNFRTSAAAKPSGAMTVINLQICKL